MASHDPGKLGTLEYASLHAKRTYTYTQLAIRCSAVTLLAAICGFWMIGVLTPVAILVAILSSACAAIFARRALVVGDPRRGLAILLLVVNLGLVLAILWTCVRLLFVIAHWSRH